MSTSPYAAGPYSATPQKPAATMNVLRRAATAARIFDVLATVVLVFGGLLVLGQLVGGVAFVLASADSESGTTVLLGIVGTFLGVIVTAIVTAINWAVITLATAVAGYIAQRSRETSFA